MIDSTPQAAERETEAPPLRRRLPFAVCVLIAMVLMFANYILAIPLSLIPGAGQLAERSPAFGLFWHVTMCLLTLATALVLTWLVTRYVLRGRLRDIGWVWTRDSWWLFLVGWAASLVPIVTCTAVMPLTGLVHHTPIPHEQGQTLTVATVTIAVVRRVASAVALQGIPEELLWRGWLMHCLVRRPRTALVVSAVVFGAMHIISNGGQENLFERLIYVVNAMAFAFCAGALALRLRSLWAAIGVHAGLHLTNMILNFTPLNATGPVIWVSTSACWLAIGLVALAGWRGDRVAMVR